MHTKQASTVEMFVEIWKTDIQPGLSNTSLSNSSTTPHTSLPNSTPLSAPRDKATPSRKRTAADANLHQQSTTPPALRPVHIISETQLKFFSIPSIRLSTIPILLIWRTINLELSSTTHARL